MNKVLKSIWVRALSSILCSVAGMSLVFYILATIFYAGVGGMDNLYQNVYDEIADTYSIFAYDSVKVGNLEYLEDFLSKRGIACSVTRQMLSDNVESTGEQIREFECGEIREDFMYERDIVDGAHFQYSTESLVGILLGYNYASATGDTVYDEVQRVVFDKEEGFFYFETEKYFFNVDLIVVYQNGSYTDYVFTEKDGKECYYNGYYDIKLDTTQYESWNSVEIDGMKMPLVEDDRFINTIHVVTTNDIQAKGIGGIIVDADLDYVEYYPEEYVDIYTIQIDWDASKAVEDSSFSEWMYLYSGIVELEDFLIPNIILSFILFVIGFVLLVYSANDEKENLGILHKAPVFLYSGILFLAELGLLMLFVEGVPMLLISYGRGSVDLGIVLEILIASVMVWLLFAWFQNIVTRLKCKSFWRTSEVYYIYKLTKACWGYLKKPVRWCWNVVTAPFRAIGNASKEMMQLARENTSLFFSGLVVFGIIAFVELFGIFWLRWNKETMVIFFVFMKAVEGAVLILVLHQMQKLQEGSKRVASGDMSQPIDTSKMFWKFKEHGENINKVSEGIALAVEERMKSERFKTELITNVSHDIKTPLTSIINYVDLIKKEDIADEKVQEYIDVLDRQSARLKKLIEDLMEASKASTGNLTVNLEECDVEVLLTQLIGEFEEKLQKNQLAIVVDKPDYPVKMMADGRHIWRVLDNLLNNACKYSLPGSRVYVSLKLENKDAVITFKNISKEALNIPSNELLERFVRGDSSRNTEGSGLGLSIAQSLTELMNGSMELEIDGDLFKVTLRFPTITTK